MQAVAVLGVLKRTCGEGRKHSSFNEGLSDAPALSSHLLFDQDHPINILYRRLITSHAITQTSSSMPQ